MTITLNGTRIFPSSHASKGACATEGPIPMDGLKPEEKRRVERFLKAQMERLLATKGVTPFIQHEILLEDPTPIRQRYRPRNPATQRIIDEEVDKMLQEGVIQPSNSPWSSQIVITRLKDGKPRFCVDFRRLNKVSKKDAYPLPQVNATLDKLRGVRYLSFIDLKNEYWHVPLTERSKPLTAFTVPGKGLFEFKVMPFGLHAAAPTFQRLLDRVITPDMAPSSFAYLDDIVICTKTLEEHMEALEKVFQKLYEAKLRPNPEKCQFFSSELTYLGHIVDENGLHTDPDKVSAILNLAPPKNLKEARRFLGLISWYCPS